MAEARHVLGRRGQLLVALPATVRKALALSPRALVYWHVAVKGEAVLTVTQRRGGGRPRADAECRWCAARERELERLRQQIVARQAAGQGQAVTQGFLQAVRQYGSLAGRLDVIGADVRALLGLLPARRSRPGRRARALAVSAPARAVEVVGSVDGVEEPDTP